jgi:hypothetical protein
VTFSLRSTFPFVSGPSILSLHELSALLFAMKRFPTKRRDFPDWGVPIEVRRGHPHRRSMPLRRRSVRPVIRRTRQAMKRSIRWTISHPTRHPSHPGSHHLLMERGWHLHHPRHHWRHHHHWGTHHVHVMRRHRVRRHLERDGRGKLMIIHWRRRRNRNRGRGSRRVWNFRIRSRSTYHMGKIFLDFRPHIFVRFQLKGMRNPLIR